MQVRIDEIVVKQRIRRNLGDLSLLMESMQEHGQLNPILITPERELIAGERRLESAKQLGWLSIDAVIVSDSDELERLQIELDENVQRKALTPDEVTDACERIRKLESPGFLLQLWHRLLRFLRRLFRFFRPS